MHFERWLSSARKQWVRLIGYLPQLMAQYSVYPDIWSNEDETESNFDYVWGWYEGLVEFYREAAAAGDGMLLHLG